MHNNLLISGLCQVRGESRASKQRTLAPPTAQLKLIPSTHHPLFFPTMKCRNRPELQTVEHLRLQRRLLTKRRRRMTVKFEFVWRSGAISHFLNTLYFCKSFFFFFSPPANSISRGRDIISTPTPHDPLKKTHSGVGVGAQRVTNGKYSYYAFCAVPRFILYDVFYCERQLSCVKLFWVFLL